jgi:hypothetical protein
VKSITPVRRASRRIHVLFGMVLTGCLMNPLLDPHLALVASRAFIVLTATFGWLIPGSWKRFVKRGAPRTRGAGVPAMLVAATADGGHDAR